MNETGQTELSHGNISSNATRGVAHTNDTEQNGPNVAARPDHFSSPWQLLTASSHRCHGNSLTGS